MNIEPLIRAIPDFPIPGILFRDITPLLKDAGGFRSAIDLFAERYRDERIDLVVAMEARGYIFGAPLAYALGAGFVPVRKPGKLPREVHERSYDLEYGSNVLQVHTDACRPGERVLVVDDVLATGGTAAAAVHLVERSGATVVGLGVLLELAFLAGRAALPGVAVQALLTA